MISNNEMYSAAFQKSLFGEMSQTYGLVNLVASFGFTSIWRSYCIRKIPPTKNAVVIDFMTGMGELFHNLNAHFDSVDGVMAVDFSEEMCAKARLGALRSPQLSCRIMEADALNSPIESGSADCVYCSFGLKTLSESQQRAFAAEVARILKPGGKFSFIEISVPTNRFFKFLFLFYLRYVIPLVGRMLLGNPSNYRMLAYYTEAFNNSSFFQNCLQQENLETQSFRHFFGSATGVYGAKNDHR